MQYQATFERTYQTYKHAIYRFAYSLLKREQDAKELMQDVFLSFYEELQRGEMPEARMRAWLFRVTKNKGLNLIRSRREGDVMPDELQDMGAAGETPERKMAQRQQSQAVQDVMNSLQERDAMLLRLYAMDMSYEEIAEIMELKLSSVGRMLYRAKQAFKVSFQRWEMSS